MQPASFAELDGLADFLRKNPTVRVEIGGHTDSVGDDAANRLLSENRARSVCNYLISNGLAENRLAAKGYGETQPVGENATEAGRAANRRVECRVIE